MTSIHVSRHPIRAPFESVQFGNAPLQSPHASQHASSEYKHNGNLESEPKYGDFLTPLPPIGDKAHQRLSPSRERYGSVSGLTMAYKRRSKKSASLPGGLIITPHRMRDHENELFPHSTRARYSRTRSRRNSKKLFDKFKMVASIAVLCIREAKKHKLRNNIFDEISPFISGLNFHDYEVPIKEHNLMFDPNQFKADKQLRISDEIRKILVKPQRERSESDVKHALLSLRNLTDFAEYPLRMQTKIAEVGFYEKYEAKRVIVRQGHPASAFYLILSGSVVVMVQDHETKAAKPVAYISKGQTFGELAIINRSTRQSTVIAKETLELLSIDIKDFHRIFMAGGVKNINDPDHNQFLRSLSILKDWPIQEMANHPKKCIFHYFRAEEVLVKDSRYSNWIIIVKSGSLKVLKKLKKTSPFSKENKSAPTTRQKKTAKQQAIEKEVRNKQRRYILPDIHIPLNRAPDSEDTEEVFMHPALRPVNHRKSYLDRLIDYSNTGSKSSPFQSTSLPSLDGDTSNGAAIRSELLRLPQISSQDRPQTWDGGKGQNANAPVGLKNASVSKMENLQDSSDESKENQFDDGETRKPKRAKKRVVVKVKAPSSAKAKKKRNKKVKKEEAEVAAEMGGRQQHIRTITHDLDTSRTKRKETTEADISPQFVEIQILTKGQVFGIRETLLDRQPSFCVVSNGAECILLDKGFYREYASDDLLRTTRNQCCPYPSDEEMQSGLQVAVNWEAYCNSTIENTLDYLKKRKLTPR